MHLLLCALSLALATGKSRGVCSGFDYSDHSDESSAGTIRTMPRQILIHRIDTPPCAVS
jgi:hypothetical protein